MLKSLLASIARKRPAAGPGDFGAAVAHFHAGRLGEANELAHRILRRDPDHAEAWNLLGAIALARGEQSAAARHFEDAAALAPLDAGIITNLAETRRRNGDLDGAEAISRQALVIDPRRVPALHTLVLTLKAQGRGAEAFEYCQLLLSLDPDFGPGREAYLFLLQLVDVLEPLQVAAEHRRLIQRIELPARWRSLRHANTPDPERRLRIGYVSADFYQHAASYFIEPVLSGHDGRGFDVICYAGVKRPDAVRSFKVPFGPIFPVLGILSCSYLMLSLPILTWVRFLVWLNLGMVIYWSYGRTHSPLVNQAESSARSPMQSLANFITTLGLLLIFNAACMTILGYMTEFGMTNETTAKWHEIGVTAEQADTFGLQFLAVAVAVWTVGFGLTKATGEKG